ncbi:MAG: recombinase RecA [Candidatus Sungbacteria bacterium]|uniref:Protein RecA n=1 Tax=Candidatus Sungiibacteriota bacterium TaxID=2750080 RepID=A0A932YZ46_9BACT|nr:recombinase RecA [Candidatus Sungbacteria bacterium]
MSKEERAEKLKILEDTVKEIQDKYGEGAIMKLGGVRKVDVDVIPTGSLALDMALGVGGVPRGRVIEIFGPESSGKTTLALHIVAEAQKQGGLAAFVDAEHALDPDYAKRLGVRVNELLISQPDTGEQALEIVDSLMRSGSVAVVVIDSVAALTPQAEIEGEMGQQHVGLQARLMSHALRKLTANVSKTKTAIIFINQIRMQIGIMFGNPETTPGGRALKFYSSVRIEVRRAAQIKKGEEIVGNRVNAKIAKNKVAAPFRRAEFDIFYNEGISRDAELLTLGEKYGVVKKAGASFTYGGTRLGQGFDNARVFLKQNPKIADEIAKKIKEAAATPAE